MPAIFNLLLNGDVRTIPAVASVRELIELLGIRSERVAVELNRRVIKRVDWENTPVRDGDKLEIVQFVGGG